VVSPHHPRDRQQFDPIDHRIGVRAVADQIAQYQHLVPLAGRSLQDRGQGLEVGMHVAEDQVAHQKPIHSSSCSTTSGTGLVESSRTWAWA
jgi:hypothetical protein